MERSPLFDNTGQAATANCCRFLINRADRHATLRERDRNRPAARQGEVKGCRLGGDIGGSGVPEARNLDRSATAPRRQPAQRCHGVRRQSGRVGRERHRNRGARGSQRRRGRRGGRRGQGRRSWHGDPTHTRQIGRRRRVHCHRRHRGIIGGGRQWQADGGHRCTRGGARRRGRHPHAGRLAVLRWPQRQPRA